MRRVTKRLVFYIPFVCLALALGVAHADVEDGLVLYWALDEGSGGTAVDSSTAGNDGTLQGGPLWVAGRTEGALQFDGVDDYVGVPRVVENNFTLAAWIRTSTAAPGGSHAYEGSGLIWCDVGGVANDYVFAVLGTKLSFFCGNPDASVNSATDVVTGDWVHVAATRNTAQQRMTIYINGVLENGIDHSNTAPLNAQAAMAVGGNTLDGRYYTGLLDDVRMYDRALTEAEILELYEWTAGAAAGKDRIVYGGDRVTLSGTGPADATSYVWEQVILGGEPTVTLETTADPAIVEFNAPSLTVGAVLTFRLTVDAPSTEGETTDEVKITVRAVNAPAVPASNLHTQPRDKGFMLFWDDVLDATEYIVQIEVAPGFWWDLGTVTGNPGVPGEMYEFKNLTLGTAVTTRVVAKNKYGAGAQSDALKYMPSRNLAVTTANGGSTPPTGNVYVISHYAIAGMNDLAYDDSNDSWDGNAKSEDYWGYLWDTPLYFDKLVYVTGQFFSDGGWFTDLRVEYTEDGATWATVPGVAITPAYDFTDAPAGRDNFLRYDIDFATVRGLGMRIYGTPGGLATFTSIAELEVYGDQMQGPLVVQGIDADVPENGTATLDGSYSFSELGPVSGHTWTQVSGTAVTIADPNAALTTFDTFPVDSDEVLVFSLTATDGTNTVTDNDVRITVKNILTTAVAGPDQLLPEGSAVTLDGSGSLSTSGSLTYSWTQLTGPTVALTGANEKVCTFTASEIWSVIKQLRFQLEVNDGVGGISQDAVNVNLTNPLFELTPVGSGYFQDLLHLGQNPSDRFLAPLDLPLDTNDYLVNWGGQASINPVAGEEYDFTDTGIDTTSNPMVWTPEHNDNGYFAWDGRASGAYDAFGQIYHVYVFSPSERPAQLHFWHDDEVRMWNNGLLAASRDGWDNDSEQNQNFTLYEGVNSMTLRLEEGNGGNRLAVRITDRNGVAFTDLSYALSVPNPLPLAYAVRSLPASYQAGAPLTVELSVRADSENLSGNVSISDAIPPGTTVADAGGGQIIGGNISWSLADVSVSTISYTLNVSAGTSGGMNFAGNVNYTGVPTQEVYGDSVVYEIPSAPANVGVEMLIAGHVSWTASPQEGIAGYRVYSSVNGQAFTEIAFVTGTAYIDGSAVPGSTYNYKVAAVNEAGFEGPLSPATGEKMVLMTIREAEDFNYGGGQYPGFGNCPAAVESPAVDDLGAGYDFWHPNKGGPRDYRPNDDIGIWTVDDPVTEAEDMGIGWIAPGSWWRYTFDVPEAGWVKLVFRIGTLANQASTITAYWDETPVGTASVAPGPWMQISYVEIEGFQTDTGVHTLRVEAGGENPALDVFDFDKIGVGFNWGPPKRQVIWDDDFEEYTNLYDNSDLVAASWTIVNGGGDANGAWRLWNTAGDDLGNEVASISGMTGNYVITDSDMAPDVQANEELITPVVDCTDYLKVRLNFAKNFRVYIDDLANAQVAEVDIRSSDDGVVWGSWVNLLHWDTQTVTDINSIPEQVDISQYADGKQIQVRFHFFQAQYDYWFAVDSIVVTGELGEQPAAPLPIIAPDGSLSWDPFGGGNYTVQFTDDLPGGVWNSVPGTAWPITATTWPGEGISGLLKRYYRVLSE